MILAGKIFLPVKKRKIRGLRNSLLFGLVQDHMHYLDVDAGRGSVDVAVMISDM